MRTTSQLVLLFATLLATDGFCAQQAQRFGTVDTRVGGSAEAQQLQTGSVPQFIGGAAKPFDPAAAMRRPLRATFVRTDNRTPFARLLGLRNAPDTRYLSQFVAAQSRSVSLLQRKPAPAYRVQAGRPTNPTPQVMRSPRVQVATPPPPPRQVMTQQPSSPAISESGQFAPHVTARKVKVARKALQSQAPAANPGLPSITAGSNDSSQAVTPPVVSARSDGVVRKVDQADKREAIAEFLRNERRKRLRQVGLPESALAIAAAPTLPAVAIRPAAVAPPEVAAPLEPVAPPAKAVLVAAAPRATAKRTPRPSQVVDTKPEPEPIQFVLDRPKVTPQPAVDFAPTPYPPVIPPAPQVAATEAIPEAPEPEDVVVPLVPDSVLSAPQLPAVSQLPRVSAVAESKSDVRREGRPVSPVVKPTRQPGRKAISKPVYEPVHKIAAAKERQQTPTPVVARSESPMGVAEKAPAPRAIPAGAIVGPVITPKGGKPRRAPVFIAPSRPLVAEAPGVASVAKSKPKAEARPMPPIHQTALRAERSAATKASTATLGHEEIQTIAASEKQRPSAKQKQKVLTIRTKPLTKREQMVADRGDMPGFKGFCPVALRDTGKLQDSTAEHRFKYQDCVYHFSSDQAAAKFAENPMRYAPFAGGRDAVTMKEKRRSKVGRLDFASWYAGRLFLFSSAESLAKFNANPARYARHAR